MVHAEVVRDEVLGRSDGTPGQRFALQRRPVVPSDGAGARSPRSHGDGTQVWTEVPHFAAVRPGRPALPHRRVRRRGPVRAGGPGRRRRPAALRRGPAAGCGAAADGVPDRRRPGAATSAAARSGCSRPASRTSPGWRTGRRPSAAPRPRRLDDAKVRGPLLLRSRGRAVTAEDFEELTRDVAPEAARVHCAADAAEGGAGVRVLVVPHVASDERRPDPAGRPRPAGRDPGADHRQPRRAPAGRHPAAGPAAGLRLADRGGEPELRGRGTTRRGARPRCCGRCTGSSTR